MRYQPTVETRTPETLRNLQRGQWISYEGARGRYMGWRRGVIWIAWGRTATHGFERFASAFNA